MKILLLNAIFATMIVGPGAVQGNEPEVWSTNLDSIALSNKEKKLLADEALMGSPEAANKLSLHYLVAEHNIERLEYWTRIAAENGNSVGQFNYAKLLLEKSDPDSERRACYWLKLSSVNGNSRAITLLQELTSNKCSTIRFSPIPGIE